jgi:hypothetical protein
MHAPTRTVTGDEFRAVIGHFPDEHAYAAGGSI